MSSELISDLYEAIDDMGTGFLGVDPDNDKCVVAFEIQANYCSEDFLLFIDIPSTVNAFNEWDCEAAFLTHDGDLSIAFVGYADMYNYEKAPNEYTTRIQIEVSADVLNNLVASTGIIAVCSCAMPVVRGQQGTVFTDPEEYLRDFEITTSLDGLSTKLATPTNLSATNITSNSAQVSWTGVENASSYKVQYRRQGDTTWNE